MKFSFLFLLTILLLGSSCNSSLNRIFTKKTPHEAYAEKLEGDSLAGQWLETSKKVLAMAQPIELPYQLSGYFQSGKPRALALRFKARQGEQINFELTKKPGPAFLLFADLYKKDGTELSHLLSADTAGAQFGFTVEESTEYVLRIQPELYRTVEYNLSASVFPSLGFPVAGKKAITGSFWGDARDAGKRRHEGIDIFAAKRTPVVAAADGYITRVAEGGIGGKTIWMRAKGQDIHLYYAHLDRHLVQEGDQVSKGDTLGLMGNTGNARYTPPHLHFGIYTSNGPVDPYPFVNKTIKAPAALVKKNLYGQLKLKSLAGTKMKAGPSKAGEILTPLAITKNGYIGELPDGSLVQVPTNAVIPVKSGNVLAKEKLQPGGSGG